jgi:hypothetical protein
MAKVRDELDDAVKPRNDVYTGLLGISLGAMIVGCVLLFLDYSQYPDKVPPKPPTPVAIKSLEAEAAPAAAAPPAGPGAAAPAQPAPPQ